MVMWPSDGGVNLWPTSSWKFPIPIGMVKDCVFFSFCDLSRDDVGVAGLRAPLRKLIWAPRSGAQRTYFFVIIKNIYFTSWTLNGDIDAHFLTFNLHYALLYLAFTWLNVFQTSCFGVCWVSLCFEWAPSIDLQSCSSLAPFHVSRTRCYYFQRFPMCYEKTLIRIPVTLKDSCLSTNIIQHYFQWLCDQPPFDLLRNYVSDP